MEEKKKTKKKKDWFTRVLCFEFMLLGLIAGMLIGSFYTVDTQEIIDLLFTVNQNTYNIEGDTHYHNISPEEFEVIPLENWFELIEPDTL